MIAPATTTSEAARALCSPGTDNDQWLRSFLLADGFSEIERSLVGQLATRPRRIAAGSYLYRAGAPFRALYAIRAGFVKTTVLDLDGTDRIIGVHFGGDIVGVDGIGVGRHARDAVTLVDCSVSEIGFPRLERLAQACPAVQRNLHRLLAHEIGEKNRQMLVLGTMHAAQKVASFLLDIYRRMTARGYSASAIDVHLTRSEIGSHLGLSLETVSRVVSRLHVEGVVEARRKGLRIKDPVGLTEMLRAIQ